MKEQEIEKQKEVLIKNADQVFKALKALGGDTTSWELKLKVRLSGSALYLALGRLEALDKVILLPEELNLHVMMTDKTASAEKKA